MDHEPHPSDEAQPLEEHAQAPGEDHLGASGEPVGEPVAAQPDDGLEHLDSEGLPSWSSQAFSESADSHQALLDTLREMEEGDEDAQYTDISGLTDPASETSEPQPEENETSDPTGARAEYSDESAHPLSEAADAAAHEEPEAVEPVAEEAGSLDEDPEWRALLEAEAAVEAEALEQSQPAETAESFEPTAELVEASADGAEPSDEPNAQETEPAEVAALQAEAVDAGAPASELTFGAEEDDALEAATSVPPDDFGWGEAEELEGAYASGEEVEEPGDADFRALINALTAEAGEGEPAHEDAGFDQSQESDDLVRALEQAGGAGDELEHETQWPVDEADLDEDADIEALGRQLNPESGEHGEEADLAAALNDELSFQELEDETALAGRDEAEGSAAHPRRPEIWLDHAEGPSVEITPEELVDRTAQESFDEMLEAFEAAEAASAVASEPAAQGELQETFEPPPSFEADLPATTSVESIAAPVEEEPDEPWSLIGASAEFDPSTLEVRRIGPEPGAGDQPVTYGFVVRNTAPVALSRVRVEHVLPTGARCIGVQPTPEVFINNSKLVWHLGEVEAGSEHCFLVRVERPGGVVLPSEATAILHACYYLKAPVTRPRLFMKIDGPASARVGEPVVFQLEIKNTGTAAARQLTLHEELGPGLHHAIGEQIDANLGILRPGESLHLTLTTTAAQPGKQTNVVTVRSAEGVHATVQAEVLLLQAALAVRASRLVHCLVDQPNEYRIEVRNPGTAPIEQALLIDTLPEELEYRGASDDGQFDAADQSVSWVIGGLKPGEIRSFFVQFQAKLPGDHAHRVLAWSDCGLEATDEATIVAEIDERQPSHLLEDLLATIDREDEQSWVAGGPHDRPTMLSRAARAAGQQHIVFSMGDVDYAIPVESVVEYGHPLGVTPVPNLPDWLLGVANLHGDIISMVDLRRFLGLEGPDYDRDGRMLVVRSKRDDLTVGLVVDRVKGIRVVGQETFAMPASPVEDRLAPFVRGATELQGRLLFLLNLDQLLHSPEMRQFEPV